MTFEDYVLNAERYYKENRQHLRRGQAYMNCLCEANRDLYHAIPWDIDPFHEDKFLYQFLLHVKSRWDLYSIHLK